MWDQSSLHILYPYSKGGEKPMPGASESEGSVRENFHSWEKDRRGSRAVLKCYRCRGPHKKRDCPKKAVFLAKGEEPGKTSAPLEPASEGSLPCCSFGAMSLVGPSEAPSGGAVDICGTREQSELPKKLPPEGEVGCVSEPAAGCPSEVELPKQERPRQPRSRKRRNRCKAKRVAQSPSHTDEEGVGTQQKADGNGSHGQERGPRRRGRFRGNFDRGGHLWQLTERRPPRPPTHRGLALAPTAGIGRALKRHPFSGLVDSAELVPSSSYPEGNFGGNQLLDGSISLSPLYPSQTNDLHVSIAAGLHQSFLWLRPAQHSSPSFGSRQACSHSNPSQKIETPWSVFQDGPNGEPAGRRQERAGAGARRDARADVHDRCDGVSAGVSSARAWAAAAIRVGPRPEPIGGPACRRSTSDRGASPAPIRFPPDNFKHSLTLFSKSFSSFLAVLVRYRSLAYLALDGIYRPIGAAFPNNPTRRQRLVVHRSGHDGALTLSGAPFQGTWARSAAEDASPDYNSDAEGARFSSWALPGSLAVTRESW
ncbi:hypothetical protein GH714_044009 [Hevea brasiliensis]|uniref:Uncharacterized protein n=1 Tax=Hevea brasiliensis TaxID=3981 RepID=A0A6A6K1C3_HEVBR|nr:hypothetical protein GH714_044009 [Hevea brasiliensis]